MNVDGRWSLRMRPLRDLDPENSLVRIDTLGFLDIGDTRPTMSSTSSAMSPAARNVGTTDDTWTWEHRIIGESVDALRDRLARSVILLLLVAGTRDDTRAREKPRNTRNHNGPETTIWASVNSEGRRGLKKCRSVDGASKRAKINDVRRLKTRGLKVPRVPERIVNIVNILQHEKFLDMVGQFFKPNSKKQPRIKKPQSKTSDTNKSLNCGAKMHMSAICENTL
ncbi:hypothetical protein K0M31_008279 [Melipona bicolor]|uniref:Uncharacterized protein n=1 Tax=Melipona bicolor TaxID=60889 RepID=A0AA40KKA4_9HYME|nr:hypothetical protein K0M31_008279 [Melipona bicolor]